MAVKKETPSTGSKITINDGQLQVPDNPIIPFIEGDGIGPDIWKATVRVFDAAVSKSYNGNMSFQYTHIAFVRRKCNHFNIV